MNKKINLASNNCAMLSKEITVALWPLPIEPALAVTPKGGADLQEAIFQSLITQFGWGSVLWAGGPLILVSKVIGSAFAGRHLIAHIGKTELLAKYGDAIIARTPLNLALTPEQNAANLDADVNLIDPNYNRTS